MKVFRILPICGLGRIEYEANSATVDKYKKAFEDTADKLSQYYRPAGRRRFSQPGLDFLKAVRVFDFKQVSLLPCFVADKEDSWC